MMTSNKLAKTTVALFFWCVLFSAGWAIAQDSQNSKESQPSTSEVSDISEDQKILNRLFQQDRDRLLKQDQIKAIIGDKRATEKALRRPRPKLLSRTIRVSLNPGAPIPLVNVIPGYSTTINVVDITGQPWPTKTSSPGNEDFFKVDQPEIAPGNKFLIWPQKEYAHSNISAILEGGTSISIQLSTVDPESDKWEVDSTINLQVDRKGPNASMPVVGEPTPSSITNTAFSFVDGVPPVKAIKLTTSPQIPSLDVWLYQEKLYIRSMDPVRFPPITDSAPAAGGFLKVYETQKGASLLVYHNGSTLEVELSEPDYYN